MEIFSPLFELENIEMTSLAALAILATVLLTNPRLIVLKSGQQVPVTGALRQDGSTVVFTANQHLYSLPLSEIDVIATNASAGEMITATPGESAEGIRLRVSAEERDRILRDLESRKPAPKTQGAAKSTSPPPSRSVTPAMTALDVTRPVDRESAIREERYWREQSHSFDEELRQKEEDLAYLRNRAQKLEDQVLSLLSLGYRSDQFALQVYQLQRTRDEIGLAELALTRAQRARDQFRDDARREGILPGWLR